MPRGSGRAGTMPEDYYNIGLEKQRADNDRTHVSTTSVVWKPDYYKGDNRFARFGLNGWTVSAIVTFQSGQPLAIITGTDDNRDGTVNDRPNPPSNTRAGPSRSVRRA